MRKLKYIAVVIFCMVLQTSFAQKPQKVVSFVQEFHDTEWYRQQAEAWKREIAKNKRNETAWQNYYRAKKCQLVLGPGEKDYKKIQVILDQVMNEMKQAIPGSYTYNVLMYYNGNGDLSRSAYMNKAVSMRPDEVTFFPGYVSFAILTNNESLFTNTCKKWYDSGEYSVGLLNYAYNEMKSMEKDGIVFANGDNSVYAKLLLQYGKNLFRDKKVVCLSFLYDEKCRERVLKELGVPPFPGTNAELFARYPGNNQLAIELIKHIIKYTHRPAYFSAMDDMLTALKDSLYSEGLLMRYSDKPYDNLAIAKRNFEQTYLLDYLKESFIPDNYKDGVAQINMNYVPGFRSLLEFYRTTGDLNNYTKLKTMLLTIIENNRFDSEDRKKEYLKCLEPSGK